MGWVQGQGLWGLLGGRMVSRPVNNVYSILERMGGRRMTGSGPEKYTKRWPEVGPSLFSGWWYGVVGFLDRQSRDGRDQLRVYLFTWWWSGTIDLSCLEGQTTFQKLRFYNTLGLFSLRSVNWYARWCFLVAWRGSGEGRTQTESSLTRTFPPWGSPPSHSYV